MNNVDNLVTMQCSAGKPWALAFTWIPLETRDTEAPTSQSTQRACCQTTQDTTSPQLVPRMPDRMGFGEAGGQVDTLSCHQVESLPMGDVLGLQRWCQQCRALGYHGSPFESCGLGGWGSILGLQQCLGGCMPKWHPHACQDPSVSSRTLNCNKVIITNVVHSVNSSCTDDLIWYNVVFLCFCLVLLLFQ